MYEAVISCKFISTLACRAGFARGMSAHQMAGGGDWDSVFALVDDRFGAAIPDRNKLMWVTR